MKPCVSVIVPIYKVESYLDKCLDSLNSQTLIDIEFILIDNGSSEECKQIILKYANDERFSTIVFPQNVGYGKAVNTGIEASSGDYIGIVESDDFIEPDMFEKLYNLASKHHADIAKAAFESFGENYQSRVDLSKAYIPTNKVFTLEDNSLLLSFHPSIWSCIYRREFLAKNNIKFIEKQGAAWVDNPFQVETLLAAKSIIYTDEPLYHYRIDIVNSSSSLKEGLKIPLCVSIDCLNLLKAYKITNGDIWLNLQHRILWYAQVTIARSRLKDIRAVCECLDSFVNIINPDYVPVKMKKFYKILQSKNMLSLIMLKKFEYCLKSLFMIKFNKDFKEIRLFGKSFNIGKRSV